MANSILRKTLILLVVAALGITALTMGLYRSATEPAYAQDTQNVLMRFVHAFPAAGAVDIYVNNGLVVPGIGFSEATPFLSFPAGDYTVSLRLAGSDPATPSLLDSPATLSPRSDGFRHVTLVVQANASGAPEAVLYTDDLSPANLGFSRIHGINTIAGSGPVDVRAETGPILQGVAFNTPAGTVNFPVRSWELFLTQAGAEQPIAEIGTLNVATGLLYTFVVVGTLSDVDVLVLEAPLFAAPGTASILVSVAHGSPDAPAVDLYVDDGSGNIALSFAGLEIGAVTPHVVLPSGTFTIAVREAGTPPNSDAAAEIEAVLESDTGALTLVAQGSLSDGTFTIAGYEDDLAGMLSNVPRVRVINAVSTGPATLELSGGVSLVEALASFSASDGTDITKGSFGVSGSVDDETGPLSLEVAETDFIGGFYYTALVYRTETDAGLTISGTRVNADALSLPGAQTTPSVVSAPETTPEETPAFSDPNQVPQTTPVAQEVTPTPPPVVVTTPAPIVTAVPQAQPNLLPPRELIGLVNLDEGVNLQCREYPSRDSRSLGVIPNGVEVQIVGYAAPADLEEGQPLNATQVQEGTFDEPKKATSFEEIWLRIDWIREDGATVGCWSRADFFLLIYRDASRQRFVDEVAEFFSYEESTDPLLPALIEPVPYNYNAPENPVLAPPTPSNQARQIATVNVDPGVNLQLRRLPDPTAESLALVPGGTELIIIERTQVELEPGVGVPESPDWLFVEYQVDGSLTTGWISSQYVILSFGGRLLKLEDVALADFVQAGESGSGSPAQPVAPQPPTTIQGALNTTGNLNLRDRPSTEGLVIISITPGSTLTVLGRTGDGLWLNVSYDAPGVGTRAGWVASEFIIVTQNNQPVSIKSLAITNPGDVDTMP